MIASPSAVSLGDAMEALRDFETVVEAWAVMRPPQRSVGFKGAGFLLLEHARTWWTSLVGAPNRAADSHGRDMSESRVHREISLRGNSPLSGASMGGPMRPDGDRGRENFSTFSRTKSSG